MVISKTKSGVRTDFTCSKCAIRLKSLPEFRSPIPPKKPPSKSFIVQPSSSAEIAQLSLAGNVCRGAQTFSFMAHSLLPRMEPRPFLCSAVDAATWVGGVGGEGHGGLTLVCLLQGLHYHILQILPTGCIWCSSPSIRLFPNPGRSSQWLASCAREARGGVPSQGGLIGCTLVILLE